MDRSKNLILFIAAMIIFGTNGLLVAKISLSSAEIVLMRTFLGFIFLLAVVAARRSFSFSDLKRDIVPATVGGAALVCALALALSLASLRRLSITEALSIGE